MVPTPVWMIIVWSRALAAGWGLAEAPGNHSDLAKIEKKGGYIALGSWNFHWLTKTNKQTSTMSNQNQAQDNLNPERAI